MQIICERLARCPQIQRSQSWSCHPDEGSFFGHWQQFEATRPLKYHHSLLSILSTRSRTTRAGVSKRSQSRNTTYEVSSFLKWAEQILMFLNFASPSRPRPSVISKASIGEANHTNRLLHSKLHSSLMNYTTRLHVTPYRTRGKVLDLPIAHPLYILVYGGIHIYLYRCGTHLVCWWWWS